MHEQVPHLRYGRKVSGETFHGFDSVNVGDVIYFTDEQEKNSFNGQLIFWRVYKKYNVDGEIFLRMTGECRVKA